MDRQPLLDHDFDVLFTSDLRQVAHGLGHDMDALLQCDRDELIEKIKTDDNDVMDILHEIDNVFGWTNTHMPAVRPGIKTWINLTGNTVVIRTNDGGEITFHPSINNEVRIVHDHAKDTKHDAPFRIDYIQPEVVNLPNPKEGIGYIVNRDVALVLAENGRGARDVLTLPHDCEKVNEDGVTVFVTNRLDATFAG